MKYLYLLSSFYILLNFTQQQISTIKDYTNMPGNQIYLFTGDPFIYVTFYNNSTETTLYGTLNIYFKSTISSSNNLTTDGFWSAVGFGQPQMTGSDILMCGILKDLKTTFCNDYEAKGWNLVPKPNSLIKLIGFTMNNNLDSNWVPYISFLSFTFLRPIDPLRLTGVLDIHLILSGRELMISSYGFLSGSTPQKHINQLPGFITLDGSIVNGKMITDLGADGIVTTNNKSKVLVQITNLKKPFSQQIESFMNINTLILLLVISIYLTFI